MRCKCSRCCWYCLLNVSHSERIMECMAHKNEHFWVWKLVFSLHSVGTHSQNSFTTSMLQFDKTNRKKHIGNLDSFAANAFFASFLFHSWGYWSIISHSDQSKLSGLIRARSGSCVIFCLRVCIHWLCDYWWKKQMNEWTDEQFHSYRMDYFTLWLKNYFICSYSPLLFRLLLLLSIKLTNKINK